MQSEERTIIMRVVETFVRTGNASDEQVKVSSLPEGKTTFVERSGEESRSIMLDEYRFDGRTIWAGYSARTGIVYLSAARA